MVYQQVWQAVLQSQLQDNMVLGHAVTDTLLCVVLLANSPTSFHGCLLPQTSLQAFVVLLHCLQLCINICSSLCFLYLSISGLFLSMLIRWLEMILSLLCCALNLKTVHQPFCTIRLVDSFIVRLCARRSHLHNMSLIGFKKGNNK